MPNKTIEAYSTNMKKFIRKKFLKTYPNGDLTFYADGSITAVLDPKSKICFPFKNIVALNRYLRP